MSNPAQPSRDTVLLPSGTTIEYTLAPPSVTRPPDSDDDGPQSEQTVGNKLVICLHPWSRLGGRLDDPVLELLVDPLHRKHYHVLRYNSRGVGNSTGWSSLTGSREVQDLKELVQWVLGIIPSVNSLVVLGYSYGSLIASCLPVVQSLKTSHILLSYPLGPRHWLTAFHSGTYSTALSALIREPKSSVLILYGDQDEFTSADSYDGWSNQLLQEAGEEGRDRVKVVKIAGATHFWRKEDAEQRLVEEIEEWLP